MGHPPERFRDAFEVAREAGLPSVPHAGETEGAESIRGALRYLHAVRIGHGVRCLEDPDLVAELRERQVPLEVCLTSNLHTHAVLDIAEHPARRYLEQGAVVTLNTDSRLMDQTTLSEEYWMAHTKLGMDRHQLEKVVLDGFRGAFLPDREKVDLISRVEPELKEIQ